MINTDSQQQSRFPAALPGWVQYCASATQVIYLKFRCMANADPVIMKSVTITNSINQAASWIARVFGKPVRLVFNRTPTSKEVLKTVDDMNVCAGHFKPRYHAFIDDNGYVGKGRFFRSDIIEYEGTLYCGTIRASNCHLLISKNKLRCTRCTTLGNTLRKMVSRATKSTDRTGTSSHVPMKHLSRVELATRSRGLAKSISARNQKIKRLQGQLNGK